MESIKPVSKHDSYLLDLKIKNSEAMVALMRGSATRTDLDALIAMSNIVEALYQLGFGADYKDVAIDGREALLQIVNRASTSGKLILNAEQIKALQNLMELHDAQMEVITIKDLERALAFAKTQFLNKRVTVLPKLEGVLS